MEVSSPVGPYFRHLSFLNPPLYYYSSSYAIFLLTLLTTFQPSPYTHFVSYILILSCLCVYSNLCLILLHSLVYLCVMNSDIFIFVSRLHIFLDHHSVGEVESLSLEQWVLIRSDQFLYNFMRIFFNCR